MVNAELRCRGSPSRKADFIAPRYGRQPYVIITKKKGNRCKHAPAGDGMGLAERRAARLAEAAFRHSGTTCRHRHSPLPICQDVPSKLALHAQASAKGHSANRLSGALSLIRTSRPCSVSSTPKAPPITGPRGFHRSCPRKRREKSKPELPSVLAPFSDWSLQPLPDSHKGARPKSPRNHAVLSLRLLPDTHKSLDLITPILMPR